MRSALYYPHTEVQTESLLKSALLLWDELTVIVPSPGFVPEYDARETYEAFSLIGRCHYPDDEEKKRAHELIEDFATRPLPPSFSYVGVAAPDQVYEIYPQKLFPETFELLRDAKLAGNPLPNADVPTASATGLCVMSILADCCAGETLVRVTDQGAAYTVLAGLLVAPEGGEGVSQTREQILQVPLKIANVNSLPLKTLVDFRKREVANADGHNIRKLRHSFCEKVEAHAHKIAAAGSRNDRSELERQFQDDMKDDYRALKEALKLEAWQVIGTKEVLTSLLAGVGALAASAFACPPHLPELASTVGSVVSIGGLLATRSKYVRTRKKVLLEHPMAYLYEAAGGLRF